MKKVLLVLTAIMLVFAVVSCNSNGAPTTVPKTSPSPGGEENGGEENGGEETEPFVKALGAGKEAADNNGDPITGGKWTFGSSADKNGTLDDLFNAKYFIMSSVGGTNGDGYGGIQFAVQGDGSGENSWAGGTTIKKTGDWTSLAHSTSDEVYFVIDLSQFPHIVALKADTSVTQAQFYINYASKADIGVVKGWVTDADLSALPSGASKFTHASATLAGDSYVSKTVAITLP